MISQYPVALQIFAFVIGLCVGSFLNVLALRSLSGTSILWPASHCPRCEHKLSPLDNIPLLSYLMLRGKCRYCSATISWQYPVVEASTALMFLCFFNYFGITWNCAGMLIFGCTLIAVTVTDFREKLIPHDITYPSMLTGIIFSSVIRQDALGAMAGIGASYILFDFLAHYGLKIYLLMHSPNGDSDEDEDEAADEEIDEGFQLQAESETEEVEVMGGGDAVLSAVISAWLGWQRLVTAIMLGFVIGTFFGMILLTRDMHRAGILKQCIRPACLWAALGFCLLAVPIFVMSNYVGQELPWLLFGVLGASGGALWGIVSVGTRVSRPFPFGPALAAGGFSAIFWDPIGLLLKGGA